MNRDRNILAHELALTLEDQSITLRPSRQLGAPTDQKLVSFVQSRCLSGFVAECDFAWKRPGQ